MPLPRIHHKRIVHCHNEDIADAPCAKLLVVFNVSWWVRVAVGCEGGGDANDDVPRDETVKREERPHVALCECFGGYFTARRDLRVLRDFGDFGRRGDGVGLGMKDCGTMRGSGESVRSKAKRSSECH